MADPAPPNYFIKKIEPGDKLTGLSLGDEAFTPLKTFLRKQCKEFSLQMLATSYGMFNGAKLVGYVTLVCGEIAAENGEDLGEVGDVEFAYKHYPAVKIARLAVDRRHQKAGIGRALVEFSLGVAQQSVSSAVGCRFVVLDAKQQSVAFYDRCGFRLIDTAANRARSQPVMFLDLKGA